MFSLISSGHISHTYTHTGGGRGEKKTCLKENRVLTVMETEINGRREENGKRNLLRIQYIPVRKF